MIQGPAVIDDGGIKASRGRRDQRRCRAPRACQCAARPPKQSYQPPLAAAQPPHPARGGHNPKPIDAHYQAIRVAMKGVFHEFGLAA
jgi:hypothetical protein